MYTEEKIERITRLILRSLRSPLSAQEQEELDAWLAEDERNRELFAKVSGRWPDAEQYARFLKVRQFDDWDALRRRIKRRRRRSIPLRRWMPYAALLVGCVVGAFLLWRHAGADVPVVAQVEAGMPGRPRAVLEFEGGEQVVLGDRTTGADDRLGRYGIAADMASIMYASTDTLKVEHHVLRIPRGGEFELVLADGSRVWLNSESVLRYPSRFVSGDRRVQVEGEAYFQVAKDASRPFVVEAGKVDVRVLGTEFNVMAYGDQKRVETTLVNGRVEVEADGQTLAMEPNTQAVYVTDGGKLFARRVDVQLYTSWKDGIFEFRDTPLEEIALRLERWYDVRFVFSTQDVARMHFTGAVRKEKPLTFFLDLIKETRSIDYRVEGQNIIIEKN